MKLTDEQREKAVRAAQAAVDVPDYSDGRWWSDIADAVAATLPDAPTNPAPTLERRPDTPSPITWEDMRAQVAELEAERDRLAAKIAGAREWIDRRGVDASDRDGDYMSGYRAAQRHALLDAHDLRRALDWGDE